jgi:foldase protein PrsA
VLAGAVVLLVAAFVVGHSSSAAVATVDGRQISLASYQQWLRSAAASAHASDSAVPSFVPDAPGYPRCIAYERKTLTKKGSKAPSTSTLRADCSEIRVGLAEDVMGFLLGAQWYLEEGAREGISISAAQVQKSLHTSFPKTTGLSTFLNSNGLSRGNLELEVRAELMAEKLGSRHSGPTPKISSAEIASFYEKNRSEMGRDTLAQATPAIRETLIEEDQAPTLDAWTTKVRKYLQPRTTCAPGYRIAYYCQGAAA